MTTLHVILLIVALLSRSRAAIIFAGLACFHAYLYYGYSGFPYYFSAALTDFMAITLMSLIHSRITDRLMMVSFVSILLNFYGWIIYEAYFEPFTYNAAFVMLYIYSIVVIGGGDAGYRQLYTRLRGLFSRTLAINSNH